MDSDDAMLLAFGLWMGLWFALLAPWDQWWNRRRLIWRELRRNLKKEN